MVVQIKSAPSWQIAAAVTVTALAAAIFVERRRRQQSEDSTSSNGTKDDSPPAIASKELVIDNDPVTVKPAEEKENEMRHSGNKKLIVLISSYTSNLQQRTSQDRALTIVKGMALGAEQLETIDGSKPLKKEKRNELFALSGIRAKYPQFFLVDANDQTTFLANWEDFESMNEMGTLKTSMNLPTKKQPPSVENGALAVSESKPVETKAVATGPTNKKVIVLISSYTSNLEQRTRQDRALTILKGMQLGTEQLETIDGAKPANKEKRNELFGLSGIRAKYPQFFVVDAKDTTTFLADWDDFEAMNEMGTLKPSINVA